MNAIVVQKIVKIYKLYGRPIDRLKEALSPLKRKYHSDFFALNDVSFEIKQGEKVGIIGKNGAGKSTLLKIITGVTTPTSGSVHVNGRIASLLELGAGFNPEYTGLENIYFQGALMGFSRKEMDGRLDEILEFADIGEFIYQPAKVYSSGMFSRLAFSIAINVNPDILIVDEALSVGDIRFQNKCYRKMEDIGSKGTTILFVSHDIQAVKKFCSKVIWMDSGRIFEQGEPGKVLENYMSFMAYGMKTTRSSIDSASAAINTRDLDSFGEKKATIDSVGFITDSGNPTNSLTQGEFVTFLCEFSTSIDLRDVSIGVLFKDRHTNEVLTFNSYMYGKALSYAPAGSRFKAKINFKVPKIYPQEYTITVALSEGTQLNHIQQHWIHEATSVTIVSCDSIDGCIVTLYHSEIDYSYEQI